MPENAAFDAHSRFAATADGVCLLLLFHSLSARGKH